MKYFGAVVVLVVLGLLLAGFVISLASSNGKYDEFAQCLTEKGVKMYGAFWCSHCNNQKVAFGSGWKYVDCVECSAPDGRSQLPVCREARVTGYPVWEFSDGSRIEGETSLSQLSQKSGCELPEA